MVSTPERCNDNIHMALNQYEFTKNLGQENHSVNFQRHCMSNIILLFVGYVHLIQSVSPEEQEICCGQTLQRAHFINK